MASGVLLALILAACSPDLGTSRGSASTAAPTKPLPSKLTVVLTDEPTDLDSLRQSSSLTRNQVAPNVIEPLAIIDPATRKPQPHLAQSWTQVDSTTWRVALRAGVKFHGGETMTADDVAASVRHTLAGGDKAASSVATILLPTVVDVRKVDSLTVDIITKGLDALFPLRLQFMTVSPASAIAKGVQSMATSPVGTGPYRFVNWTKGVNIALTRFEEYWGGPASIKDIEMTWRKESAVRAGMAKTGEAQLVDQVTAEDTKGAPKIEAVSGIDIYALLLNTTGQTQGSILQDRRARQAINYAIDRVAIRDKLYGGFASLPKGNIVPPIVLGYNSSLDDYPYDPARARALLKEAGADGKNLSVLCTAGRRLNDVELCQLLASQFTAVGLKVDAKAVPQAQWLEINRPIGGNRPDIMLGAPGNSAYDFASVTGPLFSNKIGPGTFGVQDDKLDQLVVAAQQQADVSKREAQSLEITKYVYDMAYIAPLVVPQSIWSLATNLEYKPRIDGYMFLKDARFVARP